MSREWEEAEERRYRRSTLTLKHAEAHEAREKWAREHGCKNFEEAIKLGLQVVGKRPLSA